MRATNELDRAGRTAHQVVMAALTVVAAGLTGCMAAPAYPGYGAGCGAGYTADSNAYGNNIVPTTYSSSYGSYDANTPQPYPQRPTSAYSQSQPTYSQPNYSPYPDDGDPSYQMPTGSRYGAVEHVEAIPVRSQSDDVGAVFGGVVGSLLGHQVSGGRGSTVATIDGAVVGTMAGNAVEDNTVVGQTYRVTMRLNDNSRITLTQNNPNGLRVGGRTRIENNMAMSYQPLPTWEHPRRFQKRRGPTDMAEAVTPR